MTLELLLEAMLYQGVPWWVYALAILVTLVVGNGLAFVCRQAGEPRGHAIARHTGAFAVALLVALGSAHDVSERRAEARAAAAALASGDFEVGANGFGEIVIDRVENVTVGPKDVRVITVVTAIPIETARRVDSALLAAGRGPLSVAQQ